MQIFKSNVASMDIDLAKTFLDIARSGSLIAAAERLHLTQTAVTARVKSLESQLGCQLFVRNRAGASLTAEGERFVGYATQLVQLWENARFNVPLPETKAKSVAVGGELALWGPLLLNWVADVRTACKSLAIQVTTGEASRLIDKVQSGVLDIAVVYRPEYLPGLKIEQLLEEKLIMVSAALPEPYIYVDWGPTYEQQHDSAFPGKRRAEMCIDFGLLALEYLLQYSGTGYFRARVVQRYIEEEKLHRVPNAPEFTYPIFAIYRDDHASDEVDQALDRLRVTARKNVIWR
jgi:DNA-binding transcriptional LysR family regulator